MIPQRDLLELTYNDIAVKGDLYLASRHLADFMRNAHLTRNESALDEICESYRLMKEFMLRGYQDAKRGEVYQSLLRRLFRLTCSVDLEYRMSIGGIYGIFKSHSLQLDNDSSSIQGKLEAYVQDLALLSLESGDMQREHERAVQAEHQHYISVLFEYVLVSDQWTKQDSEFWTSLLTSPTIDVHDALVLVSAIMLSCVTIYDVNKLSTLVAVYSIVADERLRQRAFVGWGLSMNLKLNGLFPEQKEILTRLFADSQVREELVSLQKQMVFCKDAERDTEELQRDIIPNLVKNNNLNITRFGISEKDEEPMQDILHPDAQDKAMEEMENSFKRMLEMQKAGSDIYFGGFSQMKRFPFFHTLSNWFVPFTEAHPALASIRTKLEDNNFLSVLFANGPFCDSDKYSFALAISSVIDTIPSNMREMLNHNESVGPVLSAEERQSAAYIRRMYLQDLYRFFRLNDVRGGFFNIFSFSNHQLDHSGFFCAYGQLPQALFTSELIELCHFLLQRKHYDYLQELFKRYPEIDDVAYLRIRAAVAMYFKNYYMAESLYENILSQDSDDENAMRGLAQAYFHNENFEEAESLYEKLSVLHPDNKRYQLNQAIAMMNQGKIEEGLNILYKLNYNYPLDHNISRALAWGLMADTKVEKAEKIYDELLLSAGVGPADYLNGGYCKWFLNKISEAVILLKTFMDKSKSFQSLSDAFASDHLLLEANHITDIDEKIMCDLTNE
uniref:Tetratricopeptide repeat protein n=1 Tax=Prevotella sp. GTC17254 TaxID=3236794 RepID=A0AB33ITM7_9BACT